MIKNIMVSMVLKLLFTGRNIFKMTKSIKNSKKLKIGDKQKHKVIVMTEYVQHTEFHKTD